jgi:hypothetical protein
MAKKLQLQEIKSSRVLLKTRLTFPEKIKNRIPKQDKSHMVE